MQSTSILATGILAFTMALTFNAVAATDSADVAAGAAVQQPETKKKIKPHSHMEEKMGAVSKAETTPEDKPAAAKKKNPAKDTSKHFHPRDGK